MNQPTHLSVICLELDVTWYYCVTSDGNGGYNRRPIVLAAAHLQSIIEPLLTVLVSPLYESVVRPL